jgi:MFS family permease
VPEDREVEGAVTFTQGLGALVRTVLVPPRTKVERNTYFLYVEIIFASILSVAGSFNGAFIIHAGGSNTLVGLLSSIPSLVAMFLYIPSARILEKQSRQVVWIVISLLLSRLGYLAIPLLPFFMHSHVPEATVGILIAMTVPSVFFSTAWSPMLAEVIPTRSRATVLAWRSILSSATIAPLIYLAGRWLDRGSFPVNYQWLYLVSFLAGAYSVYLVSRIRIEPAKPQEPAAQAIGEHKEPWLKALQSALLENRGFMRIIVNTLLFDLGAWLVGPLYIIFFVRQLGATDGWLGLQGAVAYVGVIVGYWLWRKIIRRVGESKSLLMALPVYSAYAILVALVPNLTFILFAEFLVNAIGPGVNLSHSVMFLEMLPEGKKHSSTAIYSTIMNIGAFVCPLLGVAISARIGVVPTLFIGGALRCAGAGLFYLFPIRGSGTKPLPAVP